ncbi:efflux RND transporter periplasmic adaptor subunit [Luteimonas terricola]|uniref:Resistance-nodulation-cell division (RND) efflux membrane fusion protein n=1 Tax=Luteimonas terricola TaxID=645597 RepID=A0ABQ2E9G5_9GAMM|nr:efflux RND transporter periplasmic adaptor subunit [Luteimonas terricola]GGJ98527.1 resistance-nodulation-cell division (RND) efflux membrane fusion protein [Luteimonas terricola]
MAGTRGTLWIAGAALVLLLALAISGCGDGAPDVIPPRPVLVAQPQPAAGVARSFPGEIRAREESPLAFRVGGKLVRREVDVGDRVAQGALLAVIDPGDFQAQARAAEARLSAAEAQLRRAAADRARYAALADGQLVSRSTLDAQEAAWRAADGEVRAARAQVEVARNQAGYAELRAPSDGVIASRQAEAGQVVAAGQAVFTLAGDGGREVAIALPESAVADYAVGQGVEVELWTAPGARLRGRFREISPSADPDTRTYAARVALDDADAARVALGQSAKVHAAREGSALSVPLSAVQRGDDGAASAWVFDDGRVRAVAIGTGDFGAERVPVTAGLDPDDWVVIAGGHLLQEGQEVAAVDRHNRPVTPGAAHAR